MGRCIVYTRIRMLLPIRPFNASFFFLPNFQTLKIFVTLFSGTVRPRRLKLGTHVDNWQMYRVYWNQAAAAAYSSLYFSIFLSFQFSNIKIFVTHLSGIARPKRLKLVTHVENGWMYRIYRNHTAALIRPFIFFIFLSLQFLDFKNFRHTFLRNCEA